MTTAAEPRPALEYEQEPTRTRYWVVVFAIVLAVVQYIDRVCISQAAPNISASLHLDKEQMGVVFSAFTLAYALFEIPTGYLGDVIGPRRVLTRVVLWWSLFTALTGAAWNWLALVVTRFLFGAGEAGCFPNLTKSFNRWLPAAERSRAQGIMWMSARWGGALTPLLVYYCLQFLHNNWRLAFVLFGLLGIVWVIAFRSWYRDDPRQHPAVNAAEAALLPSDAETLALHGQLPWARLYSSLTIWSLCVQYFAASYCWYFFITWFPTYLLEVRRFNLKDSALLAGLPLAFGGFGSVFAGWLAPVIARASGNVGGTRKGFGALGFLAAAILLVVSTKLHNAYAAVVAIALVSFFNDVTLPGAWTACMDVGGRYCGTVSGTMNMMGNLGGFVSPIVIGYVVKHTGNWHLTFYITAAVYVAGAVFWLLMDPVTPLEQQT